MGDEWDRELKERKKLYRATRAGVDPNAVYLPSAYGVDIAAEQMFQQELHGIVDDMKVKIVDEKKILEGTLNPEYGKGDWTIPDVPREEQNELSQSTPTGEQWKTDSPSGSWITDPILASTCESSTLCSSVELLSPSCPIALLRRPSTLLSISLCQGMLVGCGCETGVTNESCACMEQMINVPTDGMPSEEK